MLASLRASMTLTLFYDRKMPGEARFRVIQRAGPAVTVGPVMTTGLGVLRVDAGFKRLINCGVCVPHIQFPHGRKRAHRLPVRPRAGVHDAFTLIAAGAVVAPGDGQRSHQPLDVPFPRAG
jgi:hypothetical protein